MDRFDEEARNVPRSDTTIAAWGRSLCADRDRRINALCGALQVGIDWLDECAEHHRDDRKLEDDVIPRMKAALSKPLENKEDKA